MNLEQIEYVKTILETRSITRAAENLGISQSAISQSISSLEQELGLRLFNRSRSGTFPTDEGRRIIEKTLQVLSQIDQIKEEARITSKFLTGDLRIAVDPTLINVLPKLIKNFREQHPHVNITILEIPHAIINESIENLTYHIGITAQSQEYEALHTSLVFKPVNTAPVAKVVVHPTSPLISVQHLNMQQIVQYPIIFHKTAYWEKFITYYEKQYSPLNVMLMSSNTELIKRMIAENLAISILPNYLLLDDYLIQQHKLVALPIELDYGPPFCSYGYLYSNKHTDIALIQTVLSFCHN